MFRIGDIVEVNHSPNYIKIIKPRGIIVSKIHNNNGNILYKVAIPPKHIKHLRVYNNIIITSRKEMKMVS